MVNGLGVLGWGIGGLEAEMVMLGLPCTIALPRVVGVRLTGALPHGSSATDLAITLTHALRELGVAGDFVEYFGPGVSSLTVGQRAVVANMAPEYGATTGYFPIDSHSIDYLRLVAARRVDADFVQAYARANRLWFDPRTDRVYSRTLEVDLSGIGRTVAGPTRPQDSLTPGAIPASLRAADHGEAQPTGEARGGGQLPAFPVALAAITSCTNTTDPALLITAGLLARNARRLGLRAAPWVKTSLAPGSPAAARYLARTGLDDDLAALGFDIVGFGCTTCIGNSGPLPERIAAARGAGQVEPVAILSGNRNFPGRVNPDVTMSYIMTPPLVVAFAISGDAARNIETEPVGHTPAGRPVLLEELWPSQEEVAAQLAVGVTADDFPDAFAAAHASRAWQTLASPAAPRFPWSPDSTILRRPPFATAAVDGLLGDYTASPLLVLGDDITTDHISPASAIPADSPVADFLVARDESRDDLNVFASRRGNWEVMARGAFYSKTLGNRLVEADAATGTTTHADGTLASIWEVAQRYEQAGRPVVVIAGERYGTGSSRDWAAKAQRLLGVRAVPAASFERIHRSNLVGMGVLPLLLTPEQRASLGTIEAGDEFDVACPPELAPGDTVRVVRRTAAGERVELDLVADVQTEQEAQLLRAGGAIPHILRSVIDAA
ncbi:aconitate hydratase, partial [Kineosphaera limosa NBRC 100340]